MQKIISRKISLKNYTKSWGMCLAMIFAFTTANNNLGILSTVRYTLDEGKKVGIRIFPNPSPDGTIHISSNLFTDKQLQFYVFDVEGNMMHNIKLKGKDKKTITGLKKGIYMYDIFNNDVGIERGRIIVK